jgi:hypothetical protein
MMSLIGYEHRLDGAYIDEATLTFADNASSRQITPVNRIHPEVEASLLASLTGNVASGPTDFMITGINGNIDSAKQMIIEVTMTRVAPVSPYLPYSPLSVQSDWAKDIAALLVRGL